MINTTKTKQACFEKYALDVTRVPDEVESVKSLVEVRCLLHDGYYEVPYGELQKRRTVYSPGCSECKRHLRNGDRARYRTEYTADKHQNITTREVFFDVLATFPLYAEVHHEKPGHYDRPRSVSK